MARMTPANLYHLNSMGKGPKRGKLGKRLVYRKVDVVAWIVQQRELDHLAEESETTHHHPR
jgi:hypothetical protein